MILYMNFNIKLVLCCVFILEYLYEIVRKQHSMFILFAFAVSTWQEKIIYIAHQTKKPISICNFISNKVQRSFIHDKYQIYGFYIEIVFSVFMHIFKSDS